MSGIPYIGSKISLISKAEIRYEGTLYTIDSAESTVTLQNVRSHGTEERLDSCPIPPRDEVYEYIIFRGGDIKDIHVCEPPKPPPQDPAIIETSQVKPKAPCDHPAPGYGQYTPFGNSAMNIGGYSQFGGRPGVAPGSQLPHGPPPPQMQQPQPHMPPHSHPHGHGHGHFQHGVVPPQQQPVQQPSSQGHHSCGPTPTSVSVTHKSTPTPTTTDQGCQTTKSRPRKKSTSKSGRPPQHVHQDAGFHLQHGSRGSTPTQGRRSPNEEQGHMENIEHEHHHRPLQHHHHQQQQQQQHQQQRHHRNHEEQHEHERDVERDDRQQRQRGGYYRPRGRGGPRGGQAYQHPGDRDREQKHPGEQRHPHPHPAQNNRGRGRRPPPGLDRRQKEPLKFETEFDFEESNAKFDKDELEKELKQMTLNDKVVNGDNKETNSQVSEDEAEEEEPVCYNKTKSFFDSISCEATERAKGVHTRPNWREERKINSETFGVNSTKEFNRHRFSRGGRGRGGYQQGYRGRGRGRGYGGRPQGGRGGRRDYGYGYNNQQYRQNSGESQRRQPKERNEGNEAQQEIPAQ